MTSSNFIVRCDDWLIDRVFQPIANRLPAGLSAVQLGLSFQLGSLMLNGAALLLPIVLFGVTLGGLVDTALIWFMNLAFFLGMKKTIPLIRPGMMNPLRPMMLSMRMIAIAFLIYQLFRGLDGVGIGWILSQLMTLSQLTFVMGLYFVSCQPQPPRQRMSSRSGPIIEGVWSTGGRIN